MADIFDQASDYEARDREAAISAAVGRATWAGPGPDLIDGIPCCAECGEPIPVARLAAIPGVGLCVDCAE
ncbi:TraR/DksA family transcriptional regulator [Nitratidesulfovibrio vulgaris]|uniref:TraR/DksA family transcriptional regulator n=1 Tax=Nitratidesulfovibrio vulgaris TaxID=881 RepID=UPI0013DEF7FA|nr:TraR/DksA family transcriptional regulator [Nitratidesulfovibrio vulgaris]